VGPGFVVRPLHKSGRKSASQTGRKGLEVEDKLCGGEISKLPLHLTEKTNGVRHRDHLHTHCEHWGLDRHDLNIGDQIDILRILWGTKKVNKPF